MHDDSSTTNQSVQQSSRSEDGPKISRADFPAWRVMEDASEPQENRRKSGTGRGVAVDIEAEIEKEATELLVLGGQRRPSQVSRRATHESGSWESKRVSW